MKCAPSVEKWCSGAAKVKKCKWTPPRTRFRGGGILAVVLVVLCAGPAWCAREADTRLDLEVEEGRPAGTVVGAIPTRPHFTYRFNERPAEFLLNGTSGLITTAMEIDRETSSERFDLVILSSSPTYPLEVRILILDVNDNSPFFPEPSIEVSFSESANVGTRVILDTASDPDVGVNDVTNDYKIVSGNDERKFRLVVTTNPSGETPYLHLETTGRLDRETQASYALNISAEDGGTPPRFGFLLVNIAILDVNDCPPIFDHSDYSVSLNESVPPGTSVLKVHGTDNDIGDNARITYYLSDSERQFTIDPQTGVISTSEVLKCESSCGGVPGKCPNSCVFTVHARDQGSPRLDGRAYVTVNLLDANDHDPTIRFRFFPSTASYATVDENAENGSVVAAVSVIDLDEGLNGESSGVEIQGGNELGHFRLESTPSFDIVRVNNVLDREEIGKYNLTITATDRGIPPRSSTAFLIIHVNDVNDHEPVFEKNEYSAVLGEAVAVGTYVAGISATDEDTGVNALVFYAIASGNDQGWFHIDVHSGLVTTLRPLDREQEDYVELKISARDGGPNPRYAHTHLRVEVLDENDEAPAFQESHVHVALVEGAPPNTLVAVVTAVDNDLGTNGTVEYFLSPEVERLYPKQFSLDPTYGRLTLLGELDREFIEVYEIQCVAKDLGQPSLSGTVTLSLSVLDVNDEPPIFYPDRYFYTIRSSDVPGTVVARLTATDADLEDNAKSEFTLLSGADGSFEMDKNTGVVRSKVPLGVQTSRYELIVGVENTNDRTLSDKAVIFVYVAGEDQQKSTLKFDGQNKRSNFVIEENVDIGREVGRVSVTRSGVKHSFAISNGDPDKWFRIEESGVIRTARRIDREVHAFFVLEVTAYDGLGFARTTVNVTVEDVNDEVPTFSFDHPTGPIKVMEDWPIGYEVYLLKAHDKDLGLNGRIEYSSSNSTTFAIDKTTGMISLNRLVRSEVGFLYTVEVSATDLGNPPLASKVRLSFVVEDVNDQTPLFGQAAYETALLESVPVNDRFFLLRATDGDHGINKLLSYTIAHGNDDSRFGIFPDGHLYVKRPLDRERRDLYSLTITAQDSGLNSRRSSVNIVVHVIDVNDNAPTFSNKTFEFFISENEAPDTYVGRLSAEDLDKGRNAELTYTVTNAQNDFMINPKTGFIRSLRSFDREHIVQTTGHDYLVMDAVVFDGSATRLKDEARITVYITDVNDNAPRFLRTPYSAAVSEGSPVGTQVIRVQAVDADDELNGSLEYFLVRGNENGTFKIDGFTGEITVNKELDREAKATYLLTVMARDMGEETHNKTTLVRIDLLDDNDNVPNFANETIKMINISEDATVGSKICVFSATDKDLGVNAEVSFSIASGNFKETFRIEGSSGSLYLARSLDYEEKSNYLLNISAFDGGTPRLASTLEVSVVVVDVNDNVPRFSSTAVVRQVEESVPPDTPIVTLMAQDRDSGVNGRVRFNISHQDPPGGHFAIHPETGVLHTTRPIDREYSDTFRLTVVATDQAEDVAKRLSVEKIVTIIVEDVNDNAPTFISMDAGVLPGGVEKGHKIMTLSAHDPDANNNGMVTFELEGGDSALFTLDRLTGDLSTARAIERPAVSYTLTVKATDQAAVSLRRSSRNKVTIIGTGGEGGPAFASAASFSGSVAENRPVGTSVVSVRVAEEGAAVEYFLTSVSNAAGAAERRLFVINRYTGVISTASVLDREGGPPVFHLEVYAVDTAAREPRTSKAEVRVSVLDENDSRPTFVGAPYRVSLSEDALAGGREIARVSAVDPDAEGAVRFVLAPPAPHPFRLDPHTGALFLHEPLDREQTPLHRVTVRAEDGVGYSETEVVVEVLDSNDNSPVFSSPALYSFEVSEGAERGAQVGRLVARDADEGVNAEISYAIVSDYGAGVFSLNPKTGVFTLTSHLDYEQVEHYIFVCEARDSGTPSLSSTVSVVFNLLDDNDNAPLFDPLHYSHEAQEDVPPGTTLLRVTATDSDSGDNGVITYDIVDGNTDNKFGINTDGWIFTLGPLDRETQSFYSLTIRGQDKASDPGKRLSSTVLVSVILKDVNDMAPEFVTPNVTYVSESVAPNTVILAVNALDRDEGRNSYVEYSLVSPHNKFALGPIDGLLRVVGVLDRELTPEYQVGLVARDRGLSPRSSSTTLRIVVSDENDNSPLFQQPDYSATVAEDAPLGLSVLQVCASDADEAGGPNAEVRYSIAGGDPDRDFAVDDDTGVVRVRRPLDYERRPHYALTLKAEDRGGAHDTAHLAIQVLDRNDNAPSFPDSPYVVRAMEGEGLALPTPLLVLRAEDADQAGELQYRLVEGERALFSVHPHSGQLALLRPLDRERQPLYTLHVACVDAGSPRQTGTATVSIFVDDLNDNSPEFGASHYVASIIENLPVSSPVITITATDKDIGRNAEIEYSLVWNEEGRFHVDPATGTIATSGVLDREQQESYHLVLAAHDRGLIARHAPATANLTIHVLDDNDNRPQFSHDAYTVYIPDSAVGGHFVFGAVAEDSDKGPNSRLVYHLSGTDADKFYIDEKSGVLKLVDKLINKTEGFQLKVHATDSGDNPLSSATLVNVFTQKSELFPKFETGLRNFKFAESSENLLVTRLSAVSPKSAAAGKISYRIAGGNSGNAFAVDRESGAVTLVGGLDREAVPTHELLVEARDSDQPPLASVARLEITVTDVNDNKPVFRNLFYNASVKEELEPPLFVIELEATDADFGVNGNVEYHFADTNDKDNPFSLDVKTGKIFTTEILDREVRDSYVVIVTAVDHGTPQKSSSATVYINVLDKNDNPPRFTRLFSANVTENAPTGTFVIQVTSSDKDIDFNANASYSFTQNSGGKFAIDPVSGNVTVAGSIDREVKDEYVLKVAAVDGSWKAETPLTVLIEDVNDNAPEFSSPEYTFNVPEQTVAFIGEVSATDRDKKGPDSFVSYSLKRPSDLFRVDPSGRILSKQMLFYKRSARGSSSPENRHVVVVVATDHGKPALSSEATVTINVIDSNNHAPRFPGEPYFSPVPESAAVGAPVLRVEAEDGRDIGVNAEVEYAITGGNGSQHFSIHKKTGWISVSTPLVGLKDKWFSVAIEATDKGVPPKSSETTGMFSITAENLFAPAFTALSYQVVIPENEPLMSEIVTVTATDEDKGFNGEIIYSILSGNLDNHFEISPHTGSITIAKHLDYETISTYQLNILASDRGFQSKNSTAVLTVLVTDVNDNPAVFNSTHFEVDLLENEPAGTYVTQLVALDADSARNSVIEYSVVEGHDHASFEVDPKTGVVRSRAPFDYEQKNKYSIKVVVSNVGTLLFTSTSLDIRIVGRNEYFPRFVQPVFQFTVSESAALGTTVGTLEAVDEDAGPDRQVYFFLVGSSNNKGFEVGARSGVIRVSHLLDRESQSRVVLTVLAKNAGSIRGNDTDEAQVVVIIQDGNDPPVFSSAVYDARVSEAAPLDTPVLNVSAVDRDVHPSNNQFLFAIQAGNAGKAFAIDPQSGAVFTAARLDREMQSVYNLTVTATDSGNPPQSGSTLVVVHVDDVNDNAPSFDAQEVVGYVLENEPPYTSVMMLSVTDQDLPPNGPPFKFFLVGGEHQDFFEVDSHSGLVKTTKSIDRETTPVLKIIVEIQDNGKPSLSSQNLVKIMVLDKNDSPSTSRPLTVLVWVHNKNFQSRKIADVHPQDLDTVGQYQCQILEGNTAIFRIPRQCDLYATKFEKNPGTYSLTVFGNDGIHRNVSSTIKIKFLTFDNATLENSVSIRISNFSAEAFVVMYDNFLHVLNSIFKSSSHPVLFSIVNVDGHLELTLASKLKRSEHSFLPPEEVLSLLRERSALLQRDALQDRDFTLGFDPCEAAPCENAGLCRSFLEMSPPSTVDSPGLVFTAPFVSRRFSCACPAGFSGATCGAQADPCLPAPCAAGATCHREGAATFRCACPAHLEGLRCDVPRPRQSCAPTSCRNGGTCQEAPGAASFFCLCRPGFKGLACEQTADACRPNRCLNGATCVSENLGYHCLCASNYFGKHCEKSSYGFHPYSYMAFNPLPSETNDISVVFSTRMQNALLVYQFGPESGGRSDFLALEILNSIPTLSFGGSRTAITRIKANFPLSSQKYYKVNVLRNGKVASVSVVECNENGVSCEECFLGNSTCFSKSTTGDTGTLNFNGNALFVGGVPSVDALLERPGQVAANDFVGCIRALSVNGRDLDLAAPLHAALVTPTCTAPPPKEGGACADCGEGGACAPPALLRPPCVCEAGVRATSCVEASKPYSIGSGSFVELVPEERHRRTLLDRDSSAKTLSFRVRSHSRSGVLFYSGNNDEHTILKLQEGRLVYSSRVKSSSSELVEELDAAPISDGRYHQVSLCAPNGKAYAHLNVSVDGRPPHTVRSEGAPLHDFLDPYVATITIGEEHSAVSGCVKSITINNEAQTENENSTASYFRLSHRGGSAGGCQGEALGMDNATTDPLSIGVILVITFFAVLLVVILVSFLVFRKRKLNKSKGPKGIKENGNVFMEAESHPRSQCGNYIEAGNGNYLSDDLVPKKMREENALPKRPDIIENPPKRPAEVEPLEEKGGAELEESPDFYDLENASSLAPSDIINDVGVYYKGFRENNIHKMYKKAHKIPPSYNHRHSPFHSPRTDAHSPSRNILHAGNKPRSLLSKVGEGGGAKMQNTPLARLSPSSELSEAAVRILTLKDISGKPLQKALLAQGHAKGQFQDPLTNSERSLNSPVSTGSMQSGGNKLKGTLGLTSEEIERLNARPRHLSLVSTLDAVSSSNSDHHDKHKVLAELLESNTELLEGGGQGDSSDTDESGNDSFTCSEFEYDNYDKVHRGGPRNMIFSKLQEEENEDDDYAKNYDGFDSFRGSFSTLVASDDDNPPPYKPANGAMLGWDCLLNWGPNFENLVGVFKDIEQLPDNVNSSGQADEDYV